MHLIAHRLTDLSKELASIGEQESFSIPHGRGDQAKTGGGPDPRELEVQQVSLRKHLQEIVDPAPVVRLHPNAAAIYSAKVADLQEALDRPDIRSEAMQAVQSLIERIILTPDERAPNGLAIDLHGDLATILTLASTEIPRSRSVPGALLSVVAGARFERAVFRL